VALLAARDAASSPASTTREVTVWAPPGSAPLPDARAAALVSTTARERVPANARANRYVPTRAELAAFRAARTDHGQTIVQFNPRARYVTGRPGLRNPTTDQLIQWVSHKWGIPTNWIRGQLFQESQWRQSHLGDEESVPRAVYARYPAFSRVPGTDRVFRSAGIAQVKWVPDGSVGAGTEPLRWKSTAFDLDYYAATLRYYYDGACHWCEPDYRRGQGWNSVGAWYSPDPWANADAQAYVQSVRRTVMERGWTRLGS
jgi:hypothetical protein